MIVTFGIGQGPPGSPTDDTSGGPGLKPHPFEKRGCVFGVSRITIYTCEIIRL